VNVNFLDRGGDANRDPESGRPDDMAGRNLRGLEFLPLRTWTKKASGLYGPGRRQAVVVLIAPTGRWCSIPICFMKPNRIDFADGYLNRRINVTMLYGRRTSTRLTGLISCLRFRPAARV